MPSLAVVSGGIWNFGKEAWLAGGSALMGVIRVARSTSAGAPFWSFRALRKLNFGNDTNLANESGITDTNFDALDRGFIFESSLGKDSNPSSVRMNLALSDNVENKLTGVPFAEAVPLELTHREVVTGKWVDDSQNPARETVVDAASGGSTEDGAFSSSGGRRLEENGGSSFIGKQSHDAKPFAGFNTPTSEVNFVSSATAKIEFAAKRETSDFSRFKKKNGNSKPSTPVHSHLMQDLV
ncbi:hypothetical protein MLD38_004186 [Melastoma candidum]|uniref:Uncharacterized protein n=1 Tax=Melastoma candidum TaxID=119954 RepID=A0ACB9S8R9_9MYRT|nr:hypothetical protein MLD38_004186 [Melastoma candidum]